MHSYLLRTFWASLDKKYYCLRAQVHMQRLFIALLFTYLPLVQAQTGFPTNGMRDVRATRHAFINAHIQITPTTLLEHATILVDHGKIAAVGLAVKIPENTPVTDLNERFIYPSFIEIYAANFGLKKKKGDPPPKLLHPCPWSPIISPKAGVIWC